MTTEYTLEDWLEHTRNLVNELLEDGSNPEVEHVIEHHFASTDFAVLEQAAITAFKLGFELDEPEEAELENGEPIFSFDIITEQYLAIDVLLAETKKMYELAQQCKVDYDGWGTYFEE